jgi:hypothetical protein
VLNVSSVLNRAKWADRFWTRSEKSILLNC